MAPAAPLARGRAGLPAPRPRRRLGALLTKAWGSRLLKLLAVAVLALSALIPALLGLTDPPRSANGTTQLALGHFRPAELALVWLFSLGVFGVLGTSLGLILGTPGLRRLPRAARGLLHALAAAGLACILYGVGIEPYRLRVEEVRLTSPELRAPLRLVHLSDLHVRRWGRLEEDLLRAVSAAGPDLILLTGDYTATPGSTADARRLVESLAGLAPTYAVPGNAEWRKPIHSPPGRAHWLIDRSETVVARGNTLTLVGVEAGDEAALLELAGSTPESGYSILLYHFQDFIPSAGKLPFDLMLSGHSHGGQVRLPGLGPLISGTRAGLRYASGLFRVDGRYAYVTRGVGTESYGLPPLRFLCPPEVTLLLLSPSPASPTVAG